MARPRRRRLQPLIGICAAACCAALVGVLGVSIYLGDRLLHVKPVTDTYPLRIVAIDTAGRTVTLSRGPDAGEPGAFRLSWPGGHTWVGPVVSSTAATVTRQLPGASRGLAVGQRAGIQPNPFEGDPRSALRLSFTNVVVSGPVGPLPAWFLSARRHTWVLLLHGLGGSRSDTLPAMPTLHSLGFPMLAITYRGDVGAAPSPDHRSHLGDTEWRDVDAAIGYALAHGARGVVLYGWSLGGGMAVVASEQSPMRRAVRALVLDSPLLDWPATLRYGAHRYRAPTVLTWETEVMLRSLWHISLRRYDTARLAAALSKPTLVIQGSADRFVPPAITDAFARSRPDVITYLRIPGADHASAIDTDPAAYTGALRRRLQPLT